MISKEYGVYLYLLSCPSCGKKDTYFFSTNMDYCGCWAAGCMLNGKHKTTKVAKEYGFYDSIESYLNFAGGTYYSSNIFKTKASGEVFEEMLKDYEFLDTEDKTHTGVLNYLKMRKIPPENIDIFQLGISKNKDALIIPMWDWKSEPELVTYQKRYLPIYADLYGKKYDNHKDAGKTIFNLNSIHPTQIKHVTEGAICAISKGISFCSSLGYALEAAYEELVIYANSQRGLLEINLIPDIGKDEFKYWKYIGTKLKRHTDVKISITDLNLLGSFDKGINDINSIEMNYPDGAAYVDEVISKRKRL